jgi:hypothetical protein
VVLGLLGEGARYQGHAQSAASGLQVLWQKLRVIDRMEGNEKIFGKLMGDGEFRKLAVEHLLHKVYGALRNSRSSGLES